MEISQDSISEATVETKVKLTNDVMRLLQVREKNTAMAKDWLLFLATTPKFYKLTAGEVYEAYKMAMSRELFDAKGQEIEMLPELSINTLSKILNAYFKWKVENNPYQLAKSNLREMFNPSWVNKQTKEEMHEEFLQEAFSEILQNRFFSMAWLLYTDVKEKINITLAVQKRLYRIQFKKYTKEYLKDIKRKGNRTEHKELLNMIISNNEKGKGSGIVQNRCRAIVVCNYFKKCQTIEEFKSLLNS